MKERGMIAERKRAALGRLAFGRGEVLEAAALKSETNCAKGLPALLSVVAVSVGLSVGLRSRFQCN
jgi:hypothetical protein